MTKPYYSEPNITIYNGDCLEVMKELEDNSIDYCLTSPPYNLTSPVRAKSKYDHFNDNMKQFEYEEFLDKVLSELLRVTKELVLFNIMYVSGNKEALFNLIGKYSTKIKDIVIWQKPFQPAINRNCLTHNYEFIFIFSNKNNRAYEIDFGLKGDYRTCFSISNNTANTLSFNKPENTAVMSIQLAHYLISTFTKENKTILDPFYGLGTTARACKDLGRKCIGIEISRKYCDIAVKRLAQEVFNFE